MSKYNVGHTYTKCSFIANLKFTFNRACCILPGRPNSSGGNGLCRHLEVVIQEDVNLREIREKARPGESCGEPCRTHVELGYVLLAGVLAAPGPGTPTGALVFV